MLEEQKNNGILFTFIQFIENWMIAITFVAKHGSTYVLMIQLNGLEKILIKNVEFKQKPFNFLCIISIIVSF